MIIEYSLNKVMDFLNLNSWKAIKTEDLQGMYDQEKLSLARKYQQEKEQVSLISSTLNLIVMLVLMFSGAYAWLDNLLRQYTQNEMILSVLFFGFLGFCTSGMHLPFQMYNTFVIEEKYGFNKTTPATFVKDLFVGMVLSSVVGGGLLMLLTWIYGFTHSWFWLLAWLAVSGTSIFFAMFYTSWILPLFNKMTPLGDGTLRDGISELVAKTGFPMQKVMVMDGSKRSSKANAFFSGLGFKKTIVLYDTLIESMSEDEVLAVLAHEIGHYKRGHVYRSLVISLFNAAIMFFIFGIVAGSNAIPNSLHTLPSFHVSLLVFGMMYSPVGMIMNTVGNLVSRKHEYEADAFAKSQGLGNYLISSLKKLNTNHLSNPLPHPWYEFLHYSHPSVLKRIKALQE